MTKEEFFYTFKVPMAELEEIEKLIKRFGEDATLCEIKEQIRKETLSKYKFKCPKCQGKGYLVKEYNGYPTGLPDSGFVYEAAYDYKVCDVCKGIGYTEEEMEPIVKTEIIGYKKK